MPAASIAEFGILSGPSSVRTVTYARLISSILASKIPPSAPERIRALSPIGNGRAETRTRPAKTLPQALLRRDTEHDPGEPGSDKEVLDRYIEDGKDREESDQVADTGRENLHRTARSR
jgi:hypothetical protein